MNKKSSNKNRDVDDVKFFGRRSGASGRGKTDLRTQIQLMGQGRMKKPVAIKGKFGPKFQTGKRNQLVVKESLKKKEVKQEVPKVKMVNAFQEDTSVGARYRKKRTNVQVPLTTTDKEREIIAAQLKRKGMLKNLGKATRVTTVEQSLPQVSTIDVVATLDPQNFVDVCYQWALFLLSKKIGNDLTSSTSVGIVGQLYILACVVGYDLYQGCIGSYTSFSMVNMQYLELFRAVTVKERLNRKYSWNIPLDQPFFGSTGFLALIPGNPSGTFPLFNPKTMVSLSWPVSDAPNLVLSSTPPPFTDTIVVNELYAVAVNLFSQLADEDGRFKMVSVGDPTRYDHSIGAFASCSPLNDTSIANDNFCAFTNEVIIYPHEYWLAMLGFSFSPVPNPTRAGIFALNEYQAAGQYGFRLLMGFFGKRRPVRLRMKYIYVEDILASALALYIQADLFKNDEESTVLIDQSAYLTKSAIAALYSGEFLAGILCVPVDRFWTTTFLTADQTRTGDYPLCGSKYYTEQITTTIKHPENLVEGYASTFPFVINKGMWMEAMCGVLVCRGAMYANIYESNPSGDSENLKSFVQHMYPGSTVISYVFNSVNDSGITDILDPLDVNSSQFLGTAVTKALVQFNSVTSGMQANFMIVIGDANVNLDSTVLHYSRMGILNPDKVDPVVIREVEGDNDTEVAIKKIKKYVKGLAPVFTDFLSIDLIGISNRIAFSPNMVSDDLSKILPLSLVYQVVYQGIFCEVVSLPMDTYCVDDPISLDIMAAISFAHHFAGSGDESDMFNRVKIEQGMGGGYAGTFVSAIGGMITGLGY